MTVTAFSVPASGVVEQLAACGATHVVTMPDYVQIALNHRLAEGALPSVDVVNCATEDEAIAIAFGLHVGGKRPYLSMQNQGLFACANALLSLGVNSRTPLPILVGQWGRELDNLGKDPSQSRRAVVRHTEPLLDSMGIEHFRMERPSDLDVISRAFEQAHQTSAPVVVTVGAHMRWD